MIDKKKVFACNKKLDCSRCGTCCIIRDKAIMSRVDDKKIRSKIYDNIGILYLYPLSRYTISLSFDEKEALLAEAKIRGITIKIIPKKIKLVDGKHVVLDWSLDHDVCPFFDIEKKECTIYELRPVVCKTFPNQYSFDIGKNSKDPLSSPFEDAVKIGRKAISRM